MLAHVASCSITVALVLHTGLEHFAVCVDIPRNANENCPKHLCSDSDYFFLMNSSVLLFIQFYFALKEL